MTKLAHNLCHGRKPQAARFGGNIPAAIAARRDESKARRDAIRISLDAIAAAIIAGATLALFI